MRDMRKFICDRCKKEVPMHEGFAWDVLKCYDLMKGYDLCPECMEEFKGSFMGIQPEADPAQRTLDGPDEPWNSRASGGHTEGQGAER